MPFIVLPTALFVLVSYKTSYDNIDRSMNEKMMESLQTANLSIQAELNKNAAVTDSFFVFATTHSNSSLDVEYLYEDFLLGVIPLNKNTVGGGIWFEPYRFYSDHKFFGPYAYMSHGVPIFEAEYGSQIDYHREGWYNDGKNSNGEIVWSSVYHDPVPDVTMVTSTRAFYDVNGDFMGVTTADMDIVDIRDIIKNIAVGNTGRAFLLGEYGEFISYRDDLSKSVDLHIQDDTDAELAALGTTLMASDSGITSFKNHGVPQRVYFKRMSDVGWILAIAIDEAEISRSTLSQMFVLAIIPMVGLILAIASLLLSLNKLRRVAAKGQPLCATHRLRRLDGAN